MKRRTRLAVGKVCKKITPESIQMLRLAGKAAEWRRRMPGRISEEISLKKLSSSARIIARNALDNIGVRNYSPADKEKRKQILAVIPRLVMAYNTERTWFAHIWHVEGKKITEILGEKKGKAFMKTFKRQFVKHSMYVSFLLGYR